MIAVSLRSDVSARVLGLEKLVRWHCWYQPLEHFKEKVTFMAFVLIVARVVERWSPEMKRIT